MFSLSKALDFVRALKNQKQINSDYLNASFLFVYTIVPSINVGWISGLAFYSIGTAFQIASHQIIWRENFVFVICFGIGWGAGFLNGLFVAILSPVYFFLLRNGSSHRHLITLISGIFGLLVGIISFKILLPISNFTLGLYLLFGGLEAAIFGLAMAGVTETITWSYQDVWNTFQQKGKVEQPSDSKIQLRKTPHSLEILLPAREINEGIIGMQLVMISTVILFWIGKYRIGWETNKDIFGSLIVLFGILMPLFVILCSRKRVRISISAEKISLTNELWGRSLNRFGYLKRQDISELKIQTLTSYVQQERRLIIQAEKHKYELNKMTTLSQAELDWLAYELRDWLTESGWVVQFDFNYLPLQVL